MHRYFWDVIKGTERNLDKRGNLLRHSYLSIRVAREILPEVKLEVPLLMRHPSNFKGSQKSLDKITQYS